MWEGNRPSALKICHYDDVRDLATRSRARSSPVLSGCRAFGTPVLGFCARHPSEVHKISKVLSREAVYCDTSLSGFNARMIRRNRRTIASRHLRRDQSRSLQELSSLCLPYLPDDESMKSFDQLPTIAKCSPMEQFGMCLVRCRDLRCITRIGLQSRCIGYMPCH
jgi:hypothetical protein